MTSRIIVKCLPKKISEEKLKAHFSKVGVVTDAKLKYTKDGKFRQFAFVGYKSEADAQQAIEYFNNTYIDAAKIIVEPCRPLNDQNRPKAWSKYSKEAQKKSTEAELNGKEKKSVDNKKPERLTKEEKKAKKLERLIGDLKDDEQFKEFLEANKAIRSKENIWKNDINFNAKSEEEAQVEDTKTTDKKKKNKKESEKQEKQQDEQQEEVKNNSEDDEDEFENGRLFVRNLSYLCKEEDLEKLFEPYGPLVECALPLDSFSKKPKGFAYITCMFPDKAKQAYKDLDGTIFQGRMLHIIAAKNKKEPTEDDQIKQSFKQKKV